MNDWKFLLTWIRCKANVTFSCISAVTPLAVQAFSVKWVCFQGHHFFSKKYVLIGNLDRCQSRVSVEIVDQFDIFSSIWSSIGISQEITSFIHFIWFFFLDFSSKIVSLKLTLNLTWGGNTYCSKFIPNKCIAFLIRPPLSFLITSLVKIWKSISQSFFDKKLHTSTKSPTSQNFQNVILVPSSLLLWKVCIL